ncbi:MAG: hypothetical protein QME47_04175 [Candidatus Thermoplasmatota archaeon]|nr:hypothetical protein [Candidatus Thermoplasmatota archaeon]
MEVLEIFLRICVAGFALLLLSVALLSYKRTKNLRILAISACFLIFFIKGLVLLYDMLKPTFYYPIPFLCLDFLILIVLYFAVAKK